jgi:hypothetical protein
MDAEAASALRDDASRTKKSGIRGGKGTGCGIDASR